MQESSSFDIFRHHSLRHSIWDTGEDAPPSNLGAVAERRVPDDFFADLAFDARGDPRQESPARAEGCEGAVDQDDGYILDADDSVVAAAEEEPRGGGGGAGAKDSPSNLCWYWTGVEGSCSLGDRCTYYHSSNPANQAKKRKLAEARHPFAHLVKAEEKQRSVYLHPIPVAAVGEEGEARRILKNLVDEAWRKRAKAGPRESVVCRVRYVAGTNHSFIALRSAAAAERLVGVALPVSFPPSPLKASPVIRRPDNLPETTFAADCPMKTAAVPHRLFVAHLKWVVPLEDTQLASIFATIGPLAGFERRKDEQGRARTFAFVQYVDPEDAKKAIQLFNGNQYGMQNETLEVRFADKN
ncbi:hypothetical protein DIPPA_05281 [Diplonema papillatum]|nr:hypothetical protein DIPPA_05281 [Diplonema papillatum]